MQEGIHSHHMSQAMEACGKEKYPRPALTVDMLIFMEGKLLLIRRGRPPYEGMWAAPGGFVEPNETVEQAAARELLEETSLKGCVPRLLRVYSKPGRDPRGWTVSCAFTAAAPENACPRAGDDAAEARWFSVSKTAGGYTLTGKDAVLTIDTEETGVYKSSRGLAFDHGEMVLDALHYWGI